MLKENGKRRSNAHKSKQNARMMDDQWDPRTHGKEKYPEKWRHKYI